MRIWSSIVYRLSARPAPPLLVALWLSLKWRCSVSSRARIRFPSRVRIGRGSRLGACTIIAEGGTVTLGERVELQDGAILETQGGTIAVGDGSAIGPYTIVYGLGGVRIGTECSIAGQSMIVSSLHVADRTDIPIRRQGARGEPITIGDDVWIGAQCVVLPGATIGRGAIIGAGSVVRGTIGELAVAVGSPATVRRIRGAE